MADDRHYKGWVPSVVGRLSFRAIGDTSYPDRSISRNQVFYTGDGQRLRFITCYQRRPLGDAAFPWLTNCLLGETGTFYFVLTSVSRDDEPHNNMLGGRIYVFTPPVWSMGRMEARELIYLDSEIAFDEFRGHWDRTCGHLARNCDCYVDFELRRNGSCSFCNLTINTQGIADEIANYDIYNQCYFFLRDIVHRHQHHDPTADTILTLKEPRDGDDDDAWKRHVMYSLIYYLVQAKRKDVASVQARMMGVIAYARAFRKLHNMPALPYQLGNMKRSITSRMAELNSADSAKGAIRTLIFSIVIGAAAILVALSNFVSIRYSSDVVSPNAKRVVDYLAGNAEFIFWLIVASAILSILAICRRLILRTAFAKDVARVLMKVLQYSWAHRIFFALGIIFVFLSYILFEASF